MTRATVIRLTSIPAALVACMLTAGSARGQAIQGSTKVRGNVDSVLTGLLASMDDQHCRVRRTDRSRKTVTATCSGSDEELVFQVRQVGDSVVVVSQGTQGGVAAMIVGLSVIQRFMDAPPPGEERHLAAGSEWPQDERGRVGFLVFTAEGRRFASAATSEDEINGAGFDARCARVFRGENVF